MSTSLTENLRKACEEGRFSYAVLSEGVDGLTDAADIKGYFDIFVDLTKKALQRDMEDGRDSDAIKSIKEGKLTIEDASKRLALDKFAYLLNKYSSPEHKDIHTRWKQAVPELYSVNGRLPNMLGF